MRVAPGAPGLVTGCGLLGYWVLGAGCSRRAGTGCRLRPKVRKSFINKNMTFFVTVDIGFNQQKLTIIASPGSFETV